MFGDYEAQRHWMEITVNLPLNQWYRNGTDNDLLYWGLDYPPLTAYHSYLCGLVSLLINKDSVALHESRGFESDSHKLFMRYTVLAADVLLYIPAVIFYFFATRKEKPSSRISVFLSIILALFYPGLILIDHGHFQYNCISIALAIYAASFVYLNRPVFGSIFFVLALNYKQMELYHSIPFFVYLLSSCVPKPGQSFTTGLYKLAKIGSAVLLTFAVVWAPFIANPSDALQVLRRLFPVARGVFEDKVANVWCALNVLYKFKTAFRNDQMIRLCTISTLSAILPTSIDLFLRPNRRKFVLALINSSLAFFLFSYQVHEKSILLPATFIALYLPQDPIISFWFLIVSVFSMLPLLTKDGLIVASFALTLFFAAAFHITLEFSYKDPWMLVKGKRSVPHYRDFLQLLLDVHDDKIDGFKILNMTLKQIVENRKIVLRLVVYLMMAGSFLVCGLLAAAFLVFEPPEKYPDLWPLLISVFSCVHFLGFFVYFNVMQFCIPQVNEGTVYMQSTDVKHKVE